MVFFFSSKVPSNHHWLNFNTPVVMFHCLYKYSAILLDSHNTCNWQVIKRCILRCYHKKRPFKNYEGTLFGHKGANLGQYNHFILLKTQKFVKLSLNQNTYKKLPCGSKHKPFSTGLSTSFH